MYSIVGAIGFLKVIDQNKLGFIDYPGNRQSITMGHAANEDRVAQFLMDYGRRARLKMLGMLSMQHAQDADFSLCESLSTPGQARVDRVTTIGIVAIDGNCPKYIPRLYREESVNELLECRVGPLIEESQLLKKRLAKFESA